MDYWLAYCDKKEVNPFNRAQSRNGIYRCISDVPGCQASTLHGVAKTDTDAIESKLYASACNEHPQLFTAETLWIDKIHNYSVDSVHYTETSPAVKRALKSLINDNIPGYTCVKHSPEYIVEKDPPKASNVDCSTATA